MHGTDWLLIDTETTGSEIAKFKKEESEAKGKVKEVRKGTSLKLNRRS